MFTPINNSIFLCNDNHLLSKNPVSCQEHLVNSTLWSKEATWNEKCVNRGTCASPFYKFLAMNFNSIMSWGYITLSQTPFFPISTS